MRSYRDQRMVRLRYPFRGEKGAKRTESGEAVMEERRVSFEGGSAASTPRPSPWRRHSDNDKESIQSRKHSYSIDSKSSEFSRYASSTAPTVDTAITSAPSSSTSIHPLSSKIHSRLVDARHRLSGEHVRPHIPPRARAFSEDITRPPVFTASDEEYYPTPRSKHHHRPPTKAAKAKIKPLIKLAKTATSTGRSSSNSLDLSQPGGGEAGAILGLGLHTDPWGNYDEDDGRTRHLGRHQRNMSAPSASGISGSSWGNSTWQHPMRQVPRTFTNSPSYSYPGSSGSDEDNEEGGELEIGYQVFGRHSLDRPLRGSLDLPHHRTSLSTPNNRPILPTALRIRTDSHATPPSSPISTPILGGSSSYYPPILPHPTSTPVSATTVRAPGSPSYEASLNAARLAWDLKEQKRGEKAERKRRKSEGKEREKAEREEGFAFAYGGGGHGRSTSSFAVSAPSICTCGYDSGEPNTLGGAGGHDPSCQINHPSQSTAASSKPHLPIPLPLPKIFHRHHHNRENNQSGSHSSSHTHSPRTSFSALPAPSSTSEKPSHAQQNQGQQGFIGGIALKTSSSSKAGKSGRRGSQQMGVKARWLGFVIWVRTKVWRLRRGLRRCARGVVGGGASSGKGREKA